MERTHPSLNASDGFFDNLAGGSDGECERKTASMIYSTAVTAAGA